MKSINTEESKGIILQYGGDKQVENNSYPKAI